MNTLSSLSQPNLSIPVKAILASMRMVNAIPAQASRATNDLENKLISMSVTQKVMGPDMGKYIDQYL